MIPHSLFDTLLEPTFILNKEKRIVYGNETASIVCGLTIRRMQKMTFEEVLTFSEPLDWLQNLENVKDPAPYKEVRFKNAEGQEGRVQITCQPLEEGHWIVFVRDVTLEERLQQKYRGELEQKEGYILELQKAQQELEKYSKNLEKMVEERTLELSRLNQLMTALLDSLGQGFFIFDKDGLCLEVSSKACLQTIEQDPKGKKIWEIFKISDKKVEGFQKWMFTLFSEMLPFEDIAPLGPQEFPHSQGKNIAIEYFPLRSSSGIVEGVVVVSSDITSLVQARIQAEQERQHAKLILNLFQSQKEVSRFVKESETMIQDMKKLLMAPFENWDLQELFRILHTLKGGAALFSVAEMAKLSHQAENELNRFKDATSPETAEGLQRSCLSVQTSFHEFIQQSKSILGAKAFSDIRSVDVPIQEIQLLCERLSSWHQGVVLAEELKQKYILEPIESFFQSYEQVVRTTAEKENKQVAPLQFINGQLPVLGEAYSSLFACMVHAFRNSVDHGIETPQIRLEKSKPEAGSISVHFNLLKKEKYRYLQIRVQDDGGGIDPQKIRTKLDKKNYPHQKETDYQVIQHVFDSEFSTKEQITETSGRGVGMDAIRIAAEKLGGATWVESTLGQGTHLYIEVPYITELPRATAKAS